MDSAKFAFEARFYLNDLMMQLGTDTRPPVLINEDEFTQWQDRFINFIELQTNEENMMKSLSEGPFVRLKNDIFLTADEIKREKADREAKSNLMLALPNTIYNRIDCFKHDPNMMWTQLEKIMLGSSVATQIHQTRFMNNFEEFKAKDTESLKVIFDRFCTVINDLRKIKVEKTALETNMKFLNALQPEWNKSCHRLRNDVRISTMQIQELYEILMTDESLVLEKKAKMDKKKKTVDLVALFTKQLSEQALSENAYTGSTEDDGEALQKAMILLSQHYQKKFQPRSSSNSSRFTSASTIKVPDPKTASCYNCGKSGHYLKKCRAKKVRVSAYYRKKMELAEKRENGTALLAEEEFWLDYSDDEASNFEIAQMCLIGDDQSDDSETDEDEVYSEFDYNFVTSQFDIIITSLSDLHSKLISEKNLNSEKSDLIDKLKISLKDEKSILENTKDIFKKKLDDLENSNKAYLESLTTMTNLKDEFSDKINKLEEKLYQRDQSEQTIFMNKPRSEEALKQMWGLGFENPHCLNNAIEKSPTLYKYDYLTLAHYAPQFKIDGMNEKQVLEIEHEKRTNNKKNEISFVYTSENAKYFPEKSRRGRRVLNDISLIKSSMSDDFIAPYAPDSDKGNISPIIYDSKKYTPPLVLEGKIIDLENQIEDQNISKKIESDIILSFMTSSLEENLFFQNSDSISILSFDYKENKKKVSNFKIFSQNYSDSEANSDLLVDQIGCLDKSIFSDLNISSKILDDSFTLNDQYYKPKRKRRRSKKSKKQDKVISNCSNSSDSILTDRTLSTQSKKQIWRVKLKSTDSMFEGDRYVDKLYHSDSFVVCNKISKYSIKQIIQIFKNVSYSSSDSSSDDYVFSSDDCAYYSDDIPHASHIKYAYCFPIRTTTNKHGPKFKLVPKSLSDSKLQASHVKGGVIEFWLLSNSAQYPHFIDIDF
ncbi:hypothetical protein L6452_38793 [Arctium lappa]|uniref:Uncharacterized protein n=1 Tax=Arctium lappa TaxID=4217 RepID=A0ACB8XQI2_ARCLA|nr:hypothetical protein L6452_38793 [Arctium lappa]